MRMDWASIITIFLAIVLAEIFCRGVFSGGSIGGKSTSVGATTHTEATAPIIYRNPIDQFLAEKYPNAMR